MKGKVLVIILLAFLFDMRDLSAQSIIEEKLEKLSLHLGNKDAEKAERIWKSIKSSDVVSLSDSLKCMYHYHTATLDILKGNTSDYLGRAKHLELAKQYMETAPHMGVGFYDYPIIVLYLGGLYQNMLGNSDKAIQVWEDGLTKCSSVFEYYDDFQKDNYKKIFVGLSEAYKKKGLNDFALMLNIDAYENADNSLKSVEELINRAMDIDNKESDHKGAIKLLRQAQKMLSKTSSSDVYAWNHLILSQMAYAYAADSNDKLFDVLEQLYHLSSKKNLMMSFYSVVPNVCSRLVIAQDFDMLQTVLKIGEQAQEGEIKPEDKTQLIGYEQNLKGYLLFKHNQDSVANDYVTLERGSEKWVLSSLSLAKSYIISSQYDKSISISEAVVAALKDQGKEQTIAYYQCLVLITDAYLKKKDFVSALPVIEETEGLTKQCWGSESLEYGIACNNHALVLINTNFETAKSYLDHARAIYSKNYQEDAEDMISLYCNEGRYYMLASQYSQAKERLSRCVELQNKYYGYVEPHIQKWLNEVIETLNTTL